MYEKELAVAKQIAKVAGGYIRAFFDSEQYAEIKGDGTPVTIADKKINQFVIDELARYFDDGVVGEEQSTTTTTSGTGRQWFCDPLDGTKVFQWGSPLVLFSLGLVVDGKPVLGVVYDPFLNKLYEAVSNHGSYCNRIKLSVSQQPMNGGCVAISNDIERLIDDPRCVNKLREHGAKPTSFSGAVYRSCLVAQGHFVGYFDPGIKPHDVAAVQVIIEEAGGIVTDYAGNPLDYSKAFMGAIISNGVVHEDLVGCAKLF